MMKVMSSDEYEYESIVAVSLSILGKMMIMSSRKLMTLAKFATSQKMRALHRWRKYIS